MGKGSSSLPGWAVLDFLIQFFSGLLYILTGSFQGVTCRKGKKREKEKKPGYGPFHGIFSFPVVCLLNSYRKRKSFQPDQVTAAGAGTPGPHDPSLEKKESGCSVK
jgi:hypothetical protein